MKDKNLRSFDIRVASRLNSVDKAIVLHTLDYWLKKTKNRDRKNRPYIFNPVASNVNNSWHDQFPYFSVNKLIRIFDALKSERFIVTMNNNKRKYDKTKSYYLTSKYYKMINAFTETEKSNYLIEEQKKSLSSKTYSIAHSRKRKARKKYLESRAHMKSKHNNADSEQSTVINAQAQKNEIEENLAAQFEKVFGKNEYN